MVDSNEERSPGFKKSLIGKLITLGIFVAFGTAAVAWSMRACKLCSTDSVTAENGLEASSTDDKQPESSVKLQLQPVSVDNANTGFVPPGTKPAAAIGDSKPAMPNLVSPSMEFTPSVNKTTGAKQPADDNGFDPATDGRFSAQRPASQAPEPQTFGPARIAMPQPQNPAAQKNSFPTARDNPPKGPNPNPGGPDNLANRFEQLKNGAGDFGDSSVNDIEVQNEAQNEVQNEVQSAADKASDLTDNTLRNLADGTSDPKRNLLGPDPRGSLGSPPTVPAATQNGPPPITSRSSFDTSQELQPFNPNAAQPSQRPIDSRLQPPVRQPLGDPMPNTSPRQPVTQVASSGLPPVSTGLTRPTPGERTLEGMQSPSVTIEKIAPAEIQVNTPADFELVVKNTGRVVANQVRVIDQIPAGSELVQAVPQPSRGAGNQISWDLDALEPGQEKRIRIQLRPTTTGEIGSVAQVTFAAQASMRTKVTRPVLSLQHTIEPRVLIGDPVVLNMEVKNEGDGAANEVMIQEDLPEGLEFSEGFRELEYAIGTLGPGQSKKIRLELKAAKIGKYRNILVAHADGGLQTQHAVDVEVVAPQLAASGDGPTRRYLGREATHRFAVRNSGTAPATNVELACRLPRGLKFIDANNRGQYDANSHAVYWSLAEVNPGIVANVELTTKPTESGNQDLDFEVMADLNQSANAVCKLAVEHLVDIFFDIDDLVDPIEVGSDTEYKIRVVNQGTNTATNVQLAIQFPPGIEPTAVEGNITSEIRGQQIAFSPITSMNPGDEIELKLKARGVTPGDHPVSVNLIADGREINVSKQESTRVYADR